MARQVFAGGSQDYNDSVGFHPNRNRRQSQGSADFFGGATPPSGANIFGGSLPGYGGTTIPGSGPFTQANLQDLLGAVLTQNGLSPSQPGASNTPPLSLDSYISQFTPQAGRFENMFGDLLASAGQRLTNAPAVPTFEQMFKQYLDSQKYVQNQQIGNMAEAFGSQGARYGSDILQGQQDARSRFATEASNQANQFLINLEQQRQGLFNQLLGGAGQAGQLEEGRRALGYQQAFADFLRQTSAPPLLGAAASYAQGGGGGTLVY